MLILSLNVMLTVGWNPLNAQTIIQGEIDRSFKVDSFLVLYTTNPVQENNIYSKGEEKTIQVTDGKFEVELPNLPKTFYILFRFPAVDYKLKSDKFRSFQGNPLLLKSGNATSIRISPKEISFDGDNKMLLDCQFELNQLKASLNVSLINIGNQYDFNDPENIQMRTNELLHKQKVLVDQMEKRATKLVEEEFGQISVAFRNQILYDFIGMIKSSELKKYIFKAKQDAVISKYVIDFYMQNNINNVEDDLVSNYLGKSRTYAPYLSSKISTDLWMATSGIGKKLSINLPIVLDVAENRYEGDIYDQVAFSAFLNKSIYNDIDENTYIRLFSSIGRVEFRDNIIKDFDRKKGGNRSFQFSLVDESGKFLSNANFKGKALLFDFWFTGCSGCISLHKKMKPIKEHFKDNPNVVFVSVCVDSKEELWKKSIISGQYTDDRDVKLWVGPGNLTHPILKHYDIASYPTMVLVDANDKLAMVNPPKPSDEKSSRELIFRIEKAMHGMKL